MDSNTFDKISGAGKRFAIIRARFNDKITQGLLDGAKQTLLDAEVAEGDVEVIEVPGSFEISFAAEQLARTKKFDAIICLGAIIKGDTKHDEHLAQAVYQAMQEVARVHGVPVIAGVLTTLDKAQAEKRSTKMNRGIEAARTALEMTRLSERF